MGYVENFYAALAQETVQASGTATAPSADTVLTSVSLTPGIWDITVYASYGAVAGTFDDMRLRDNTAGASIFTPLPVAAAANGQPVPITVRKKLLVTSTIQVRNIGAGPATSVYRAVISARLVQTVNL